MIIYLNRGFILEQAIVPAIQKYFSDIGLKERYQGNFDVSVSNDHPFARLLIEDQGNAQAAGLFPAVVITTETDTKAGQFNGIMEFDGLSINLDDIGKLEASGYDITKKNIAYLRDAATISETLYGYTSIIRRTDHVTIEIWAENVQVKNELYEDIRLFVAGFMKQVMETAYMNHGLTVFDNTIRGQRSNNWNFDFGVKLAGAQISFDADYFIEQSIIDTEIIEFGSETIVEVTNRVKGL